MIAALGLSACAAPAIAAENEQGDDVSTVVFSTQHLRPMATAQSGVMQSRLGLDPGWIRKERLSPISATEYRRREGQVPQEGVRAISIQRKRFTVRSRDVASAREAVRVHQRAAIHTGDPALPDDYKQAQRLDQFAKVGVTPDWRPNAGGTGLEPRALSLEPASIHQQLIGWRWHGLWLSWLQARGPPRRKAPLLNCGNAHHVDLPVRDSQGRWPSASNANGRFCFCWPHNDYQRLRDNIRI